MVLLEMLGLVMSRAVKTVFADKVQGSGWGENINWVPLFDFLYDEHPPRKPIMMLVYEVDNITCQRIGALFAAHSGIQQLSQYFVMVKMEPKEFPKMRIGDGNYVPRFVFLHTNGVPYWYVIGPHPTLLYFYEDMDLLAANMKRVLEIYPTEP